MAADGNEVLLIVSEYALGDVVQVVWVALVVAVLALVWVAVEPDCSYLVSDGDDWLVGHLDDVEDIIVSTVLLSYLCKLWVRSKTFTKPFEVEVNSTHVDESA